MSYNDVDWFWLHFKKLFWVVWRTTTPEVNFIVSSPWQQDQLLFFTCNSLFNLTLTKILKSQCLQGSHSKVNVRPQDERTKDTEVSSITTEGRCLTGRRIIGGKSRENAALTHTDNNKYMIENITNVYFKKNIYRTRPVYKMFTATGLQHKEILIHHTTWTEVKSRRVTIHPQLLVTVVDSTACPPRSVFEVPGWTQCFWVSQPQKFGCDVNKSEDRAFTFARVEQDKRKGLIHSFVNH